MPDDVRPSRPGSKEEEIEPVKPFTADVSSGDDTQPTTTTFNTLGAPALPVKEQKKRGKALGYTLLSLLILGLAGSAAYLYMDNESLRRDVATAQTETQAVQKKLAATDSETDKTTTETPNAPLTDDEKLELAASTYSCVLADFGCDKNVLTTLKKRVPTAQELQTPSPTSATKYAIVEVKSSTGMKTNLWLVNEGTDWVVVYDGTTAPSAQVADKFDLPADFRTLPAAQQTAPTTRQ